MKARVVALASGEGYQDGQRRVTLRFEDAANWARDIVLSVGALPFVGVALDDVLEVRFLHAPTRQQERDAMPGIIPGTVGMGRDLTDEEVAKAKAAAEDARRAGRGKW